MKPKEGPQGIFFATSHLICDMSLHIFVSLNQTKPLVGAEVSQQIRYININRFNKYILDSLLE